MGCSACKCVRRRRPLAITVLLMLLVSGCSGRDPRELERQRAEKAQQQLAHQRCERDHRLLPPLLAALSRAEERVAAIAAEGYVPSPGPKPLDPSEQERLAVYDQEVEQEQYNQALAAWQEREQQRQSLWRRDRRGRLADARDRRRQRQMCIRDSADCVPRYGHTGCAARLYAQLLCTAVGSSTPASELQLQLDQQYEQAAIDFRGITAAQIEKAAVGYYVPMLCPDKRIEIRELFAPLEDAPQS